MSELDDSVQAARVQQFARDLAATSPPSEAPEIEQLRTDFIQDQRRRSAHSYATIKAIEDRLAGNRPEEELALAQARQDLLQAMKDFQAYAPNQSLPTQNAWKWTDVMSTVSTVQVQWMREHSESRFSRATSRLRKMCHGLHNHSAILKMVPSENIYVSLISGAVSMLIKASATHIGITESFANGIVEINDAVAEVETQIYDSAILQRLVMRLYSHVFAYLRKFMKWHTDRKRTRFLQSFNENLKETFQEDIKKVKDTCTTLSRQIQKYISADVKITKLLVGNQNANLEYLIRLHEESSRDTKLRDAAITETVQNMLNNRYQRPTEDVQHSLERIMQQYYEKLSKEISGLAMSNLLIQQAKTQEESKQLQIAISESSCELSEEGNGPGTDYQGQHYRGMDVGVFTTHLEEFHDWEKVYPFHHDPQTILDDPVVVARLENFTTSMSSQILYLYDEPYAADHPHFLQQAVGAYILFARQQCIPVVSYFCTPPHEKPPANRTRESIELCSAMYSMLRQMINLLPSDFVARKAMFTEAALNELDGKLTTWNQALEMFTELVDCLGLPVILFVIDGLNLVEDHPRSHTFAKATSLVCRLRSIVEMRAKSRMVKVLFSTEGTSHILSSQLNDADSMCCREISSPRGPRAKFKLRLSY